MSGPPVLSVLCCRAHDSEDLMVDLTFKLHPSSGVTNTHVALKTEKQVFCLYPNDVASHILNLHGMHLQL